jgi:hypothetical protein
MFSQGGRTWHRVVLRDVSGDDSLDWAPTTLEALPGDPFGAASVGADPIDLANFVGKTREWTPRRIRALELQVFPDGHGGRSLLAFRVSGSLIGDSVAVLAYPVVAVGAVGSVLSPEFEP